MAIKLGRTYDDASMVMHEAKALAIKTWGAGGCVFNGKPTELVPTYKVGKIEVVEGKSVKTWLGTGFDWDRAFAAAGIKLPEKKVSAKKAAALVAAKAEADTAAAKKAAAANKRAARKAITDAAEKSGVKVLTEAPAASE